MGVVAKPPTKNGDKPMKTKNKYVGLDVHSVYPPPAAPRATRETTLIAVPDRPAKGADQKSRSILPASLGTNGGAPKHG